MVGSSNALGVTAHTVVLGAGDGLGRRHMATLCEITADTWIYRAKGGQSRVSETRGVLTWTEPPSVSAES